MNNAMFTLKSNETARLKAEIERLKIENENMERMIALAGENVPIDEYRKLVDALKEAAGVIHLLQKIHFNYHHANIIKAQIEADNHPAYLAAQTVIANAEKLLHET